MHLALAESALVKRVIDLIYLHVHQTGIGNHSHFMQYLVNYMIDQGFDDDQVNEAVSLLFSSDNFAAVENNSSPPAFSMETSDYKNVEFEVTVL